METQKEVYNPFADPNELYSAVRTLPPASGPSGSTARPEPEHNTGYLRPTSVTQPDLGSALDLRERHVGGTGVSSGGSAGGAGPGASGAGGLGLGVAGVPGRSVTTGAAGIYAYDQSGDLGMGSPGFDRANDFARYAEMFTFNCTVQDSSVERVTKLRCKLCGCSRCLSLIRRERNAILSSRAI